MNPMNITNNVVKQTSPKVGSGKKSHKEKSTVKGALAYPITRTHEVSPLMDSFKNGDGSGETLTSKEVNVLLTHYFDYQAVPAAGTTSQKAVFTYIFDQSQELLGSVSGRPGTGGQGTVLTRVNRVRLYVYPRSVNGQNADNVFVVMTSVPGISGGQTDITSANVPFNMHQQSLEVTPTFTPHWHKCFDMDVSKTFNSPAVQPPSQLGSGFTLFQTAIVNPDDLEPSVTQKYQLKVVIDCSQTVATSNKFNMAKGYGSSFTGLPSGAAFEVLPAFLQVTGMSDTS